MNRDVETVARRLGISIADLTSRVAVVRMAEYEREKSHAAIDLVVDAGRARCVCRRLAELCYGPFKVYRFYYLSSYI